MKVSEKWIQEWVTLKNSSKFVADQITMLGLKSSYIVNKEVNGVVISCIKKIINYTDTLNLCIIEDGKQFWQAICSTKDKDVSVNQKIAFAKIGTLLPNNVKILNKDFYGIESWGIVCKYSEIKLIGVANKNNIDKAIIFFPNDAPIGFDVGKLNNVIDIETLPNRSDCFSIRGIARELSVINNLTESHIINTGQVKKKHTRKFYYSITNSVPKFCPKLCSRVIEAINVNTQTPWWIYERLQMSGVDSVDFIVDLINYVMLEVGQPIHCYDLKNIQGKITVRMAKKNEYIALVNGKFLKLKEDTLIIADDIGPLNIAGIIGSNRTKINKNTKNILLLSAFFTPSIIAGKASYYGLYTDFAYRYERGVDSKLQNVALERISNLLICIAGSKSTLSKLSNIAVQSYLQNNSIINLKVCSIKKILGYHIKKNEIEDILNRLGFNIIKKNIKIWSVISPSWRFDVSTQEDLIEEVARIYGYNNKMLALGRGSKSKIQVPPYYKSVSESVLTKDQIYSQLIYRGYQEVITYSFISPKLHKYLQPNIYTPILNNPISKDFSVMRSSLWPGLIKALIYNFNRQQTRIALFELGLVFFGKNVANVKQVEKLGGIFTGTRYIGGWNINHYKTDFFDIKGDLEVLIRLGGDFNNWNFKSAIHPTLHSGKSAKILRNNKTVGWIGVLNPPICYYFGLPFEIFIFELDLAYLLKGKLQKFNNASRFPVINRDLAFLIQKDLSVSQVIKKIRIKAGKFLIELILFDVYADFSKFYNSITLRLTWQHPYRTLFDTEIENNLNNILTYLKDRYDIVYRF
ncbi:phenylalanine--tRNA ligase subunit beta [Candidatus Portiera aleyrodidarum]|uniref:Phenylalanine--tRNA ligase beta subunit n=1 Tax=Candidatus Portiera aleyrodidarum MED (Bemisia tabaci) TaxID=1163752 RepID=A0AAU8RP90_9GAMM|nr:phenylalanine--tRNA ligase subunit beta [Candidatus Portiera aleyrodidarum]AFQ24151.1 phenylalanyl-tRNA synthetase, beta subunit [Candidatus Portiera aleyrodidarum BT-B-HRs]AFS18913.1 Phenylalanyl-tRNA synthetase beta chain [Candidatus Portiera aleyrodidarum BT-QVLC]AFT80552.1 Phenylalanyl-tRNA synthetase beta chain [Candidatus Portiera aleyrodidarum BT-QVLC]AJF24127.1 phenylalanyl-tRNA synthetase subunit beta [Candidatus Portiera aleyrodidarum MED (Bemisia tabaci)]ASX27289.1 phenylalanine-